MLAEPSPPRFEVQIVIIIIIITIFLCVAFLYYSISVNFFGVWRRILLSRVLAISWKTPSHPVTSKIHLHNPEGVLEGCLKAIHFDRFRFYIRMICVRNRILRKNLLSLVLICFHISRYSRKLRGHAFKISPVLTFWDVFSRTLLTINNVISLAIFVISTCEFFRDYKLYLPYGLVQFCCPWKFTCAY